jgi:hypothetical protein
MMDRISFSGKDFPYAFVIFILSLVFSTGMKSKYLVNTSGKAGSQIPQLPLGDDSSPWGR